MIIRQQMKKLHTIITPVNTSCRGRVMPVIATNSTSNTEKEKTTYFGIKVNKKRISNQNKVVNEPEMGE